MTEPELEVSWDMTPIRDALRKDPIGVLLTGDDVENYLKSKGKKKEKKASTKHVQEANECFAELGDSEEYRPRYLKYYKMAALSFTDLKELKEKAKSAREPGRYFLAAARKTLGITKQKQ